MTKIVLWLCLSTFLSACQIEQATQLAAVSADADRAETDSEVVATYSFTDNQHIAGKIALPIRHQQQQYWLLTSEKQGLLLTDAKSNTLAHYPGNIELIDRRAQVKIGAETLDLLATVDNESGDILLIGLDWKNQKFSLLDSFTHPAAVEVLCLQTLPQGHSAIFIADEAGMLTQRIVIDGDRHALTNTLLRRFVGVPQVTDCSVDDNANALYVVEQTVGVWRYSADPEAELQRELIAVTGKLGPLEGEVTSVAVLADGSLLVASPEQQGLWHIDLNKTPGEVLIELEHAQAIESAQALNTDKGLLVGLFDDYTGLYRHAILPINVQARGGKKGSLKTVQPMAETLPVSVPGDAADDPAIWLNALHPEKARILGTNKKRGLNVYDLQGELIQHLDIGRLNNVDIRYGFELGEQTFDLAATSNRTTNSISLFTIEPQTGKVTYLQDIATDLTEVYGLCMAYINKQYYVLVNDTDGRFQQYQLTAEGTNINGKLVRKFTIGSQPEGCVVDDDHAQLYFGEEARGIWQLSLLAPNSLPELIAPLSGTFVADVEGMGIYRQDGKRYLVASSQGNNTFGVFALDKGNHYLGSFEITMNLATKIDGVSETDGLEIIATGLGKDLPFGLLVAQDGHNVMPNEAQNFKLVDAQPIAVLIREWLQDIN
ncbi:MAG: 3-phytase [Paraglaciecola sp.]|jgi:3-phytase